MDPGPQMTSGFFGHCEMAGFCPETDLAGRAAGRKGEDRLHDRLVEGGVEGLATGRHRKGEAGARIDPLHVRFDFGPDEFSSATITTGLTPGRWRMSKS